MKTKAIVASLATIALSAPLVAAGIDHQSYHHSAPVTKLSDAEIQKRADALPDPRTGWDFYVGALAAGSIGDARFRANSLITNTGGADIANDYSGRDQSPYARVGIFLGAIYNFSEAWYGGLEVEGSLDDMKLRFDFNDPQIGADFGQAAISYVLARKFQIVTSVIFGYNCTPTSSVYVKFGAGFTGFDHTETRPDSVTGAVDRERTLEVSFVPAIGVQTNLSDCVLMRFEISAELFGKDSSHNVSIVPANPAARRLNIDNFAKTESYAAKLGVLYRF